MFWFVLKFELSFICFGINVTVLGPHRHKLDVYEHMSDWKAVMQHRTRRKVTLVLIIDPLFSAVLSGRLSHTHLNVHEFTL